MFDIFRKKKRKVEFSTHQQLERLAELSPPSTLVSLVKKNQGVEDLEEPFFYGGIKKI